MALEVIPAAADQKPILGNLLELYVHDFSEFLHLDVGPDGRFGYPHLSSYWSDPGRHPFLVQLNGQWAGFVLVKTGSEVSGDPGIWDIAEFFVMRGYRRHGYGTEIAQNVFRRLPGRWEVRVMEANRNALHFWERAISGFMGRTIEPVLVEKGGKRWQLFSF